MALFCLATAVSRPLPSPNVALAHHALGSQGWRALDGLLTQNYTFTIRHWRPFQ